MRMIRLLYRHHLAPAAVELGEVFDADDDLARDLLRDGSAEMVDDPAPADKAPAKTGKG